MRRIVVWAALIAMVAALAVPGAALATFPGQNGAIAFVRDGDIWTVNPDGSGLDQVTSGPALDDEPAWSPDGQTIAFSRWEEGGDAGDIWLVRPGSEPVRFTDTPGFWEWGPAWAPDGSRITFSRACASVAPDPGPDCGLYGQMRGTVVIARTDGGGEVPVGLGGASSWSPDGTRFVFDTGWDAGTLSLANADGGGVHEVPGSDWWDPEVYVGIDFAPSWSPDGTQIAYSRSRAEGTGISVTRPDGTGRFDLVPALLGNDVHHPAWSPDGRFIAYSDDGDGEVWVMRADGTDRHPITSGLPPGITRPDWQTIPAPVQQPPVQEQPPVTPPLTPPAGAVPASPAGTPGRSAAKPAQCTRFPRLIRDVTRTMVRTQRAAKRAARPAARKAAAKRLRALATKRAKYRAAYRARCR